MATPLGAALALARLIPPGPVLELCCGLGGLTRGLAQQHRVLAADRSLARLAQARANLAAWGLAGRVAWLCCDLTRPVLIRPASQPWAACVLDPDWSPPGRPPRQWTERLDDMEPPALELAAWALGLSPRLALRLPPAASPKALAELGPCRLVPVRGQEGIRFKFALVGAWQDAPREIVLQA